MSLGGGSKSNQTTTQISEPPKYLQPYLQQGAQQAQDIYNRGPAQYYPGQTVTPFSDETQAALTGITNRATTGSDVTRNASNFASSILGGAPSTQFGANVNPYASMATSFNGMTSNPALDMTFGRAADQVTNRLQSSFAGSGRNTGAARPVAADELGSLAAGIYGPAYENERNRELAITQQQLGIGGAGYESERDRMLGDINSQRSQQLGVLGLSPQISGQEYADFDRLAGVGAMREDFTGREMQDAANRWDYNQNARGNALDQYLSRLLGQPGGTVTTNTPIYRNTGANILGGAMLGQNIGQGFGGNGGNWGAGLGALVGLLG